MADRYGDERPLAGVVHAIAGASRDSFSKPAHELDASDYGDAFDTSALSLLRAVQAVRPNLRARGGIVTFGFGEVGKVVAGYGGPMSTAKAALSQMVVELAASLGKADPPARTAEIVTGYVPTRSGRGVALGQPGRARPADVEARFAETAPLADSNGADQAEAAGLLAVRFIAGPEHRQTTGARLPVHAGFDIVGVNFFKEHLQAAPYISVTYT